MKKVMMVIKLWINIVAILTDIDFDLNEGYDKMGFKISTNAELEEDYLTPRLDIIDEAGDLATEKEKQMAKINKYENKDAVMIANIINLNTQMGISRCRRLCN